MGIFKNSVGRPTNRSIRIKNITKIIILVVAVFTVSSLVVFLSSIGNKKITNTENVVTSNEHK